MANVSKIILYHRDMFFFARKRTPRKPDKDNKLELPGGRLDKGETPFEALIRELAEEEESGTVAEKAAALGLTPVEIAIKKTRHFVYHMPLSEEELERIRMNPEENYGYRLLNRALVMDPDRMGDRWLFTRRTVQIFAELRRLGLFPYEDV